VCGQADGVVSDSEGAEDPRDDTEDPGGVTTSGAIAVLSPLEPCVEAARPGEFFRCVLEQGWCGLQNQKREETSVACMHRVMRQGRCKLWSQDKGAVSTACHRRQERTTRTDRAQTVSWQKIETLGIFGRPQTYA
jgi:hypothetical protein